MKDVFAADRRRPLHHRVRVQHAPVTQFDFVANYRVGTNLDPGAELRARRDRGLQMDVRNAHALDSSALASGLASFGFGSRSTILHISVASAASCPSTVARPSNFAKSPPRQERTLISSLSWSPGTTGRRKRAPSTATK